MMYTIGSVWHLLFILEPILTLEYRVLERKEKNSAFCTVGPSVGSVGDLGGEQKPLEHLQYLA